MENFVWQTAKIVGNAKVGQWAQVFSQDGLFAVIAISDGENRQEVTLGKKILSELLEKYTSFPKKNLRELKVACSEIKKEAGAEKISLLAGMVVGRVLYLSCQGGSRAQIKRGKTPTTVLEGEESVSGFLQEGDILILETPQFSQIITSAILEASLGNFLEEIAENLAPHVQGAPENALSAALILSFTKREEVEKEEEFLLAEEKLEEKKGFKGILENLISSLPNLKFFSRWKIPSVLRLRRPQTEEEKSRRTLLTVAGVLVILLSLSIFVGLSKGKESKKAQEFNNLYQAANEKYEEGKSLLGLNNTLARQSLFSAQEKLAQIQKIQKLSRQEKRKFEELGQKIEATLTEAAGAHKISETPLFWDLNLVKDGAEGQKLALYKKTLAILDKKNKSVYTLSAQTKSSQIVAGGEKLEEASLLGIHGDQVYILGKEGILEVNVKDKSTKLQIAKDNDWGEIIDLFAYGGNLYLLDRGKNQIWKYMRTEEGFSEKKNYLSRDVKPDFQKAVSFAIDGAIWVLYQDGNILKFLQGRPETFSFSGLDVAFSQPSAIFTTDEAKNLYILDSGNKRIVVFEKSGLYLSQYVWEELGKAQDLVADEEEKKIFVLSGSKIYAIEIK